MIILRLCLSVAAENIDYLVCDHVLYCLTCRLEVLARIEMIGMSVQVAADGCGHCKAKIGVDVYLAHCHGCCLAELSLGNTDRAGHIAAVFVDLLYKLLRYGGCSVKDYRKAGQTAFDILKNVKAELGLRAGLELICAVRGADSLSLIHI